MGTRSHINIINRQGITRVTKYNQWDGHFESLGIRILIYLHSCDFNKLDDVITKTERVKYSQVHSDNYPSRDLSWQYLYELEGGNIKYLFIDEDSWWDEYTYTIDLQNQTFTASTCNKQGGDDKYVFDLNNLPSPSEYVNQTCKEYFYFNSTLSYSISRELNSPELLLTTNDIKNLDNIVSNLLSSDLERIVLRMHNLERENQYYTRDINLIARYFALVAEDKVKISVLTYYLLTIKVENGV